MLDMFFNLIKRWLIFHRKKKEYYDNLEGRISLRSSRGMLYKQLQHHVNVLKLVGYNVLHAYCDNPYRGYIFLSLNKKQIKPLYKYYKRDLSINGVGDCLSMKDLLYELKMKAKEEVSYQVGIIINF